jgi:hypothetical protein
VAPVEDQRAAEADWVPAEAVAEAVVPLVQRGAVVHRQVEALREAAAWPVGRPAAAAYHATEARPDPGASPWQEVLAA